MTNDVFFKNEKGHTLLELTIVLLLLTVLSSLVILKMESPYDAGKRQQFIMQFKQDLYFAQQMAISNGLTTKVIFLNESNEYFLRQGGNIILKRPFILHDTVFIRGTLSLTDISFLPNGNVQKSGSLMIRIGDYHYRLVLLLGRGRFYIEEL